MAQDTLSREGLVCDVQLDPRRVSTVLILGNEGPADFTDSDLADDSLWTTVARRFDYAAHYSSRAAAFDRRPVLPRDDDSLDDRIF